MKILKAIIAAVWVFFCCPGRCCDGAVEVGFPDSFGQADEIPVIRKAARRNGCFGDDFLLLLAIRKAENGCKGREFGIINPKCDAEMWRNPESTLDIQAGWAAATIMKHHRRFGSCYECVGDAGGFAASYQYRVTDAFIDSLAERYCPFDADPKGHVNWKKNVKYWFEKFRVEGIQL